jgi:uncharacterized protein (TIGR03437 family)
VNNTTAQIIAPSGTGIQGAVLARPGDVILLYGTGFGPTTAQPGQAAEGPEPITGMTATIGGAPASMPYAGAAPNFVGLQQFNLVVPNLGPGNHAVIIRQGSFATQPQVFLPVGP